jgi:hypothetical protein
LSEDLVAALGWVVLVGMRGGGSAFAERCRRVEWWGASKPLVQCAWFWFRLRARRAVEPATERVTADLAHPTPAA